MYSSSIIGAIERVSVLVPLNNFDCNGIAIVWPDNFLDMGSPEAPVRFKDTVTLL